MGSWSYSCRLGLAQGTCNKYEHDPNSRGAHAKLGGCPSCKYRISANSETEIADIQFETT